MLTKANRPFPRVSDDDVVDFLVVEAVALKAAVEDEEARKAAEKQAWAAQEKQRLQQQLGQ